jgi:hypothetical protein
VLPLSGPSKIDAGNVDGTFGASYCSMGVQYNQLVDCRRAYALDIHLVSRMSELKAHGRPRTVENKMKQCPALNITPLA